MNKYRGFTLTELIITLIIVAIIVAYAVPNYVRLIQENKLVTVTNELLASLNFAKSESIRQGVSVSVCPTIDINSTSCNMSSWSGGWIVYKTVFGQIALIKRYEPLPVDINISLMSEPITFNATGFLNSKPISLIVSPKQCLQTDTRIIDISTSGRMSVKKQRC